MGKGTRVSDNPGNGYGQSLTGALVRFNVQIERIAHLLLVAVEETLCDKYLISHQQTAHCAVVGANKRGRADQREVIGVNCLDVKRLERGSRVAQPTSGSDHRCIVADGSNAFELVEKGQVARLERDTWRADCDISSIGRADISRECVLQHQAHKLQRDYCHHTYGDTEHREDSALPAPEQRTRGIVEVKRDFHRFLLLPVPLVRGHTARKIGFCDLPVHNRNAAVRVQCNLRIMSSDDKGLAGLSA